MQQFRRKRVQVHILIAIQVQICKNLGSGLAAELPPKHCNKFIDLKGAISIQVKVVEYLFNSVFLTQDLCSDSGCQELCVLNASVTIEVKFLKVSLASSGVVPSV